MTAKAVQPSASAPYHYAGEGFPTAPGVVTIWVASVLTLALTPCHCGVRLFGVVPSRDSRITLA
jgi:hypothetical protein